VSEYIGIRELCSLCIHGELKDRDKYGELKPERTVCCNPKSDFYNMATTGILCTPCFRAKTFEEEKTVEYVGF